jgi:hypothetical protein
MGVGEFPFSPCLVKISLVESLEMRRAFHRCLLLSFGLLCVSACHVAPSRYAESWDTLEVQESQKRLVQSAQTHLRARRIYVENQRFPSDCSGLVGAVLYRNGFNLGYGTSALGFRGNGVRIIHDFVARVGDLYEDTRPQPGDLVFFSNTYDRNHDRRLNDSLTHIGVVEGLEKDGTIHFIHHAGGDVRRDQMNLEKVWSHRDETGKVINSYLRRKLRRDPPGTKYLTGQLYAGFGRLRPTSSP